MLNGKLNFCAVSGFRFRIFLPDFQNFVWSFNFRVEKFCGKSKKKESPQAVAQRCSFKKEFLKILQNSQENICAREKE